MSGHPPESRPRSLPLQNNVKFAERMGGTSLSKETLFASLPLLVHYEFLLRVVLPF